MSLVQARTSDVQSLPGLARPGEARFIDTEKNFRCGSSLRQPQFHDREPEQVRSAPLARLFRSLVMANTMSRNKRNSPKCPESNSCRN